MNHNHTGIQRYTSPLKYKGYTYILIVSYTSSSLLTIRGDDLAICSIR